MTAVLLVLIGLVFVFVDLHVGGTVKVIQEYGITRVVDDDRINLMPDAVGLAMIGLGLVLAVSLLRRAPSRRTWAQLAIACVGIGLVAVDLVVDRYGAGDERRNRVADCAAVDERSIELLGMSQDELEERVDRDPHDLAARAELLQRQQLRGGPVSARTWAPVIRRCPHLQGNRAVFVIDDPEAIAALWAEQLEQHPDDPYVLANAGWFAYVHTRGRERGRQLIERAADLAPHDPSIAGLRALIDPDGR
jgi:hypothetical protein